jgi:sugar (pentulose or hexulose) kinase
MWNDKRARIESDELNAACEDGSLRGATAFRPTFTLSKALWVMRNEPEAFSLTAFILSAGDWILGLMHGLRPVTDYTNALKSGANLETLEWPIGLERLGIDRAHLPAIIAPGMPIGLILPAVAEAWGLSDKTQIVAGMTDASAAQVAAGAVDSGEWVTTIGTGLSIKGNSSVRLEDTSGAVYSHRHWREGWVPSATSHCGADAIGVRFAGEDLDFLTRAAAARSISTVLVLPLSTVGEFFPFYAPKARGFELGSSADAGDLFRGYLEGIAFVERLAMEKMEALGVHVTGPQITMGGGAQNSEWMSIRASVLGRNVVRPEKTSSAFGAAIIALAESPQEISGAARLLVKYSFEAVPQMEAATAYHDRYGEFLDELSRRGYLDGALL